MKPSDDILSLYPFYEGSDAETIADMCAVSQLSERAVRVFAKKMVAGGKWKEVKVKRNNIISNAYIKIKD